MNTTCRTCEYYDKRGRRKIHEKYKDSFYCFVCEKSTQAFFHNTDYADFWGISIECAGCHNYILYISPEMEIWKEEIYIGELCLIRNLNSQLTSLIGENDREIVSVEKIMQFSSYYELKKRVQTMKVFS